MSSINNNLNFKELNIGDLLIQHVTEPIKMEKLIRRGIIVEINKSCCSIQWMGNTDSDFDFKKLTVLKGSLRKMIMDGVMLHYPVGKSPV
jgi:hypothetical protein